MTVSGEVIVISWHYSWCSGRGSFFCLLQFSIAGAIIFIVIRKIY